MSVATRRSGQDKSQTITLRKRRGTIKFPHLLVPDQLNGQQCLATLDERHCLELVKREDDAPRKGRVRLSLTGEWVSAAAFKNMGGQTRRKGKMPTVIDRKGFGLDTKSAVVHTLTV